MGFEVLDKDGNGDATRDEIEASILSIHRERLSLEASMRDLDGAVRRLDDIFLVIVFVIAILILAAAIVSFSSLTRIDRNADIGTRPPKSLRS